MNTGAANARWSAALVDELARAGVRDVCACPGSRSTPLAVAFARHPAFKLWMHLDERSAAYFALGLARFTRRPAAVLCTSGSAAANFFPAIVEARYARVPLIVLTADRPHELRDTGAPQTIDQIKLYGAHVKWFVEMALPEASPPALRYAASIARRAAAQASAAPAGPVHLNCPFREPLMPQGAEELPPAAAPDLPPQVIVDAAQPAACAEAIDAAAAELRAGSRGLIVCGPHDGADYAGVVGELGARLGFPILADPLSQVRCGRHNRQMVIDSYDAFLRIEEFTRRFAPDIVLRFGALPTSKPLVRYLEAQAGGCRQVLVDTAGWYDPALTAARVVQAEPRLFCTRLLEVLGEHAVMHQTRQWSEQWLQAASASRSAIARHLEGIAVPFEGKVFSELAALMPSGATLFAGNSMPVRDLDTFFPGGEAPIRFIANRGANGIDGVVSSAMGASAYAAAPTVLAIGDLSFYHDSNGLLAARLHRLKATVVLLHNDGGGIFSFLPQADHAEHFEQLFGTPHGLDFSHFAAAYGAVFTRVKTWPEFRRAVGEGLQSSGVNIVELPTERTSNVRMHRETWAAAASAVRAAISR